MIYEKGSETDLELGAMFESDCFGLCVSTEERTWGILDFVTKKEMTFRPKCLSFRMTGIVEYI